MDNKHDVLRIHELASSIISNIHSNLYNSTNPDQSCEHKKNNFYFIKLPIRKSCQFSLNVEYILKCSKEKQNPANS